MSWKFLERLFIVVSLIFFTEGFWEFIPHSLRQLICLAIYGITAVLLVQRKKQTLQAFKSGGIIWGLILLVWLSVFWSDSPTTTIRQSFAFTGTTLFGIYFATFTADRKLRLLAWAFGAATILSFLIALVIPSHGPASGIGWEGIYHQKNMLGRIMLLSATVFYLMGCKVGKHRWFYWLMFAISTLLLFLSNSKTSLAIFFIIIVFMPLYRNLRRSYKTAITLFCIQISTGVAVTFAVMINLGAILDSQGRDLTFTGRTDVWDLMIDMIEKRPWFGYGFGGFWRGWDGASAYVWGALSWFPEHGHNGFLDLWLELGFVGVCIFGTCLIITALKAQKHISLTRTPEYLFPPSYLIFLCLTNLSESLILLQNTIFWVLLVSIFSSSLTSDAITQKRTIKRSVYFIPKNKTNMLLR